MNTAMELLLVEPQDTVELCRSVVRPLTVRLALLEMLSDPTLTESPERVN